jgi:hypothetical protein
MMNQREGVIAVAAAVAAAVATTATARYARGVESG